MPSWTTADALAAGLGAIADALSTTARETRMGEEHNLVDALLCISWSIGELSRSIDRLASTRSDGGER